MVGSALLRALREKGYKNLIYRTHSELDLSRQQAVEEFFQNERPDYVFLAAAKVGGILANNTYKAEFIYQNIMIAANVIHSAYRAGVKKLLNFGSSCIYPKFAEQPLKEEYLLTGSLEPTNEPYAIAKISALKLCRYYNEQYRTNFMSVMPTNLYGPNDDYNLETAHALPALIRKIHLARLLSLKQFDSIKRDVLHYRIGFDMDRNINLDNEDSIASTLNGLGISADYVTLWGSGEVYREFMHVDDLAEASIYLMERYDCTETGELVNIGTGQDIKINQLAALIMENIGYEGELRHDIAKPAGTPRKLLDLGKISRLGWKAEIDLHAGIKSTYAWYFNEIKEDQINT